MIPFIWTSRVGDINTEFQKQSSDCFCVWGGVGIHWEGILGNFQVWLQWEVLVKTDWKVHVRFIETLNKCTLYLNKICI